MLLIFLYFLLFLKVSDLGKTKAEDNISCLQPVGSIDCQQKTMRDIAGLKSYRTKTPQDLKITVKACSLILLNVKRTRG